MDERTRIEIEAAAFRGLIEHLRRRTDVQSIDLINLAGFSRNCLSEWHLAAAREHRVELTDEDAREAISGMPYAEWKARYRREATREQQRCFEETNALYVAVSGCEDR